MGELRRLTSPVAMDDAAARHEQNLVATGGLLAAVAASSCCIVPLLLFSLGVSGAWIGNLTRLAPYQPIFVAMTLACLGYGYWLVWRAPRTACAEDAACSPPPPNRVVTIALLAAPLPVAAGAAVDFPTPPIL